MDLFISVYSVPFGYKALEFRCKAWSEPGTAKQGEVWQGKASCLNDLLQGKVWHGSVG